MSIHGKNNSYSHSLSLSLSPLTLSAALELVANSSTFWPTSKLSENKSDDQCMCIFFVHM